jgi:uncharacterized protein (TIGR02145 family)
MKKNLLLLLAMVSTMLTANAQWQLQSNPLGTGEAAMVGKIQFVSATEGWIAASRSGKLLHTVDGGSHWTVVDPFPALTAANFSDPGLTLSFPNAMRGYALKTLIKGQGDDLFSLSDGAVLFQTTDGGANWSKAHFPKAITTAEYVSSDLTGTWQVHALLTRNSTQSQSVSKWMNGTCTIDANGSSVLSLSQSSGNPVLRTFTMTVNSRGKVSVENIEMGFLGADKNTLILTTDEDYNDPVLYVLQKQQVGVTYTSAEMQGTWQMHSLSAGNSTGAHSGWAHATLTCDAGGNVTGNYTGVGGSGSLNSTITIDANGTIGGMTNMASSFHGFMSADKQTFYATMTGSANNDYNLIAFQKVQPQTSYSTADLMGIWHTQSLVADNVNDGSSWSSWSRSQSIISSQGQVSISSLVVNGDTRDQMRTQMSLTSAGTVRFSGVDACDGFLSADKNLMIFTMPDMGSGGYTFGVMQRDASVSGDIGFQVQFVDENTGWLTCYNPLYERFIVYKTTDGAQHWDTLHANAGGIFHYIDAHNGWMIGTDVQSVGAGTLSNILHTTDGGSSWQTQASDIGNANALQFTDALNGWVAGRNGLVMHTSDGGAHWNSVTNTGLGANTTSKALCFVDANHGWIGSGYENTEGVGTRFVLATKDGGATWSNQPTPVTNSIFSISAWDPTHVWFASDYGQIASYLAPKTVDLTAGSLNAALGDTEKSTLQRLALTGTMDARDFKVLRDQFPALVDLDLSEVTVAAYTGSEGTVSGAYAYPAHTMPRNALLRNTQLQRVVLPSTLVSIGRSAFNGCTALSELSLPATLQKVDSMAFRDCSSLKQLILPSSVNALGYGAFIGAGLVQIDLNEGLTSIGEYAFQGCDSLRHLGLPSTLTQIGYCAFTYLNGLESIEVASSNPRYCSQEGVLFDKAKTRLMAYPALKSAHYEVPMGVEIIDTAAFEGNWTLKSVTLPTSVTEIAPEAFCGCPNFSVVDVPTSVTKVGAYAFYNCSGLSALFTNSQTPLAMAVSDSIFRNVNAGCVVYVPKGSVANYQSSDGWSHYFSRMKEYEKVTDVDGNVYHGIQIGTQTWLVENLRTRRYQNLDSIQTTSDPNLDLTHSPGANFTWNIYDDAANAYVYGRLYTWNAATDPRGLCPIGWKVPSNADFQTLLSYLSNQPSVAKSLAAAGLWWYDDSACPDGSPAKDPSLNNESGLALFPAGIRHTEGNFDGTWGVTFLWTSDVLSTYPEAYYLENQSVAPAHGPFRPQEGFSVRCVRDPNVSVEDLRSEGMSIYPNPASTSFRVKGLSSASARIVVAGLSGEVLLSGTVTADQPFSVGQLADGVYLVSITTTTGTKTNTLIVRHGR